MGASPQLTLTTLSAADPSPSTFSSGVSLPAAATASWLLTALRISAGGGSCGSVSSSHSGFRGSAARANHKLLCVWEARRLVLLYIAADLLRLHYVTLPLLQGRGPRGERARARGRSRSPRWVSARRPRGLASRGCATGRDPVRKPRSWRDPEEFPWEDFLFSRFLKGEEEGEGEN